MPDQREGSRGELLALRPELAEQVRLLHGAIWDGPVDPVTLELCRLRTATLLRCRSALEERSPAAVAAGLDEAHIAELPSWPSSGRFTAEQRACLGFAELWVIDPHAITDADAATVVEHLGEAGMVTFTTALAVWDGQHRFDNALAVARP